MASKKLVIPSSKMDINLKFYYYLKRLAQTKLTDNQASKLLGQLIMPNSCDTRLQILSQFAGTLKGAKREKYALLIEDIHQDIDLKVFIFSLNLFLIKDLLRAESSFTETINNAEKAKLHPLSLRYDNLTICAPYSMRVKGALLSLLLFERLEAGDTNFLLQDTQDYLEDLSREAIDLRREGLESNQIFMLMFSESLNQSITSNSGSNYEDRILSVLHKIGVPEETIARTVHDSGSSRIEYDLFFKLDGRSYGISAKRTFRERYKQLLEVGLGKDIDVGIALTLGEDLTKEKAQNLISIGYKIFVADEVYRNRPFLQNLDGVYSAESLTLATLRAFPFARRR